jgi:iron(III) transport system permease protein
MGAHPGKVLTTVSLPLLVPGLASACVLLFGYSFADLGNPLLLGGDFPVLSSQIYLAIIGQFDMSKGAALAVLLLLPAAFLFFLQKRLASRTAHASVGGRASVRHPQVSHPAARVAALVVCGGTALVIVMQYATVLAAAITRLFGIDNALTLRHFEAALTSSRGALVDTIGLGVAAATAAAVLGVLIAYYVARTRAFGRDALDFIASLPLAIPGTVIGLGFALAFNHRPLLLTGTAFIIVAAFAAACAAVQRPIRRRFAPAAASVARRGVDEPGRDTRADAVAGTVAAAAARGCRRNDLHVHAQRHDAERGHLRRLAALVAGHADDTFADGSR